MGCSAAALTAASLLVWLAAADASSVWYGQETSRMIEEWKAKHGHVGEECRFKNCRRHVVDRADYQGIPSSGPSSQSFLTVEEMILGPGVPLGDESYEDETRRLFVGWKAKLGRTYKGIGEEECRYAVFKNTRRLVDLFDYERGSAFSYGLNGFGDLFAGEIPCGYGIHMEEQSYEEETRRMFAGWKAMYGKTYKDVGEEKCRYAAFKANRRNIVRLNAAAGETAYGLNQFGDLSIEEVRARCYGREGGVWNNPDMEGDLSARCQAVTAADLPQYYRLKRLIQSLVCRCTARELNLLKQSTESGSGVIPGDEAHMSI